MSKASGLCLDPFIRSLRRRVAFWRLMEGAALGLVVSCAAALPLIIVLLWRKHAALPQAAGILGVGAACGACRALWQRTSAIAVAGSADQTFLLNDLLSTAVALGQSVPVPADAWAASVRAQADLRCRKLSIGRVPVRRLRARAWGAICLGTILVMLLACIDTTSHESADGDALASGRRSEFSTDSSESPAALLGVSAMQDRRRSRDQELDDQAPGGADDATQTRQAAASGTGTPPDVAPQLLGANGAEGAGQGQGQTTVSQAAQPAEARSDERDPASETGRGSGGAPSGNAETTVADEQAGRLAGHTREVAPPPRWRTDSWPAAVRRAQASLASGVVPAAYQDVVRSYFDKTGY